VPVTAPLPVLRASPAGNGPPDTDHVSGGVPPVAAAVCEYGVPSVPPGNAAVVMLRPPAMVMDNAFDADAPTLSLTASVKLAVPAVVGVPVIAPVPALRFSPAGSAPTVTDQLSGAVPPLAVAVCEYATPAVLPGKALVVITGAAAIAIDSA